MYFGMGFSLGLSHFGFSSSESVCLYLSLSWEVFSHFYFEIFQPFFFSFQDSDDTNSRYLFCSIDSWESVQFFRLFCLCCSDYANFISLSSSSLILSCHLHFAIELIQQAKNFFFSYWILKIISVLILVTEFLKITLISLLRFSILSLVSRGFVLACWSIFMTALKSFSQLLTSVSSQHWCL